MSDSSLSEPAVRPRVVSEFTGERLLLDDALEPVLERAGSGAICIFGPSGSGKSSALASLRSKLPKQLLVELLDEWEKRVELLDEPGRPLIAELSQRNVVIYTAEKPFDLPHLATLRLAPWGEDEAIEFLMATCKDRCASVIRRLRATRAGDPLDLPKLWVLTLNLMAQDESLPDVDAALRRYLDLRVPPGTRIRARENALQKLLFPDGTPKALETHSNDPWGDPGYMEFLRNGLVPANLVWLVRNPRFRLLLAAEKLVDPATGAVSFDDLECTLPEPLIRLAGKSLADRPEAQSRLIADMSKSPKLQPVGASLLNTA